ncbi:MAG: PD40 domain-containing protein [Lachnospiraceae bacterium]|nr:PD40 domain-containing protein [Lachnospiraceae bacterium]
MSNIGRTYPSEMKTYQDPKTGKEILQLTDQYENVHIYFTDNSFTLGDQEIYFLSNRPNAESEIFNFFKMDLNTGVITQVTDEPTGIAGGRTKTPDSEYLVYMTDHRKTIKKLDTKTGETTVLYHEDDDGYTIQSPFVSCDKQFVGFIRNEALPIEVGKNYVGFKESMYACKDAYVMVAYMDGSGAFPVFHDTHWLGHFQFSPDMPNIASFCHEGPWNYVQQRIWLLDIVSKKAWPCFRQEEDDSVGHEFWTRDGNIFFDNRMAGHDGTITVSRTQAVTDDHAGKPGQIPYVGLADKKGEVIKRIDMPFYCNHYHANNDNTKLVGDEVDDLVLIDMATEPATLTTLLNHGTSWNGQNTHCHPTWSWDASKILYCSDRDGKCNLYIVKP